MDEILFDKPVENLSEDFLSRKDFSVKIADALIYTNKDPLVIGLYGSWGSGKTSVINMIIDDIRNNKVSKNIIIMQFNPWIISNQKQLITQFFQQLSFVIDDSNTENTQKIARELSQYALEFLPDVLSIAQFVLGVPIPVLTFKNILSKIKKRFKNDMEQKNNILIQRENINNLLAQFDGKIIVFIDDIDRLNNEEIREIFQLVKSIANFNNIVYFLAFDKSVVLKALDKVQEGNCEEYLEKIVQIPISMPSFDRQATIHYLFSKIELIMERSKRKFNSEAFVDMFYAGMYPYFKTLRDVNRYLNILQFNLSVLYNETNFEDLCAITAIQVFNSNLYNKIADNLDVFIGLTSNSAYNYQSLKNRCEIILDKQNLAAHEKELLMKMFPKLKGYYRKHFFSEDHLNIYRQNKHICSPDIAERYFILHVKDTDITKKEFETIIQFLPEEDKFSQKVNECFISGKFENLLLLLMDNIDEYDAKYYLNILKSLYSLKFCKEVDLRDLRSWCISYDICSITMRLLKRISKNERLSILFLIFSSEDTFLEQCIYIMVKINRQEQENENIHYDLEFTSQELEKINNVIIQRIQKLAVTGEIFNNHDTIDLLRCWKTFDITNSINEFLKSIVNDSSKILLLLSSALHATIISRSDTVIQEKKLELNLDELSQII